MTGPAIPAPRKQQQWAWRPVSRKYSPIVTPQYGAMNWSGADSYRGSALADLVSLEK